MEGYDRELIAKVSDFGLALFAELAENTFFSSLNYPLIAAPERLTGIPFTEKCDVYRYEL